MPDAAFVPSFALFSGGHDSLCATHVAMESGAAQEVLHINTGIGIPETTEFVIETCRREGRKNVVAKARSKFAATTFGCSGFGRT